jgi:uncharacterized integral membrane protein (TIGR00698 family)
MVPSFASPLFVAVAAGVVVGNVLPATSNARPLLRFAATWLLRVGVVLLGLRLSLADLGRIGPRGLIVVLVTVSATFFGAQWLGHRLGVTSDLSLLVGTGYAICGISAVTALNGVIRAEDEEATYAIGLVTLAGSLSIIVLPLLGQGLDPIAFGTWVGGAVHDVAQTVATASTSTDAATEAAIVVKLTRVALLAPLVLAVTVWRRRTRPIDETRKPPIIPWFIVGFLMLVAVRSTGWLDQGLLDGIRRLELWLFIVALFGVGSGVSLTRLRRLGGRPLQLGLLTWLVVAGISYLGVVLLS